MKYSIEPSPQVAIPVAGSDEMFPVRRIYCVGQNYAEHVREMGGDPSKTQPVFFSKPNNAIVTNNKAIPFPLVTENLHFEAELVVALKAGGENLNNAQARAAVFGYGVGIDFTRRDLQAKFKSKGQPWDVAKGFDNSAPISAIRPAAECDQAENSRIWLKVNDEIKQDGNTNDLIWNVAAIIAELSRYFCLAAGDLIFTGTPSGVGQVKAGDIVTAAVENIGELKVELLTGDQ